MVESGKVWRHHNPQKTGDDDALLPNTTQRGRDRNGRHAIEDESKHPRTNAHSIGGRPCRSLRRDVGHARKRAGKSEGHADLGARLHPRWMDFLCAACACIFISCRRVKVGSARDDDRFRFVPCRVLLLARRLKSIRWSATATATCLLCARVHSTLVHAHHESQPMRRP